MVADGRWISQICHTLPVCSFTGQMPVADMLYLTPEGAPHVFRPPSSALSGTDFMPDKKGYSFDGCSPIYLVNNATVRDGLIVFPGGAEYKIMVLPEVRTMTPVLIEKVRSLVEAGATIIGNPPDASPSLTGYPECDEQVARVASELWGKAEIPAELESRDFGSGKIWWGMKLHNIKWGIHDDPDSLSLYPEYELTRSILGLKGVPPDFASATGNIRFTHRSMPDRDIYFISNKTDLQIKDTCLFRDGTLSAELWNPLNSEIRPLSAVYGKDGITKVAVRLEPGQSYFIVFNNSGEKKTEKYKDTEIFSDKQILMELDGPWDVAFDTTWGGPANIRFNTLSDWSERPEDGIRFYSGIALYSKTFDLPESQRSANRSDIYLNLGKVRNLARVKLNGMDLGVVWTAPWEVNISEAVKKNNNHLEIEVANLWINRLIGDESHAMGRD